MNQKKILEALDFTPEPFIYFDNGLDKYVVLCFLCDPNYWDECEGETTADLVLKEHVFQTHSTPGGSDGILGTT